MRSIALCILIMSCACFSRAQSVDTLAGYVVETDQMDQEIDGCHFRAGYFLSDGNGEIAWMNLGGKVTKVKKLQEFSSDTSSVRAWVYAAGEYYISIEFSPKKTQFHQKPEGESDDTEDYDATITVRKGTLQQVIQVNATLSC